MFKFFENLLDPFAPYTENAQPPQKVFAFLWEYLCGFRTIFIITGVLSVAVSLIEVWFVAYIGHLVNIMSDTGRAEFWGQYGGELILVALFILFMRPLVQTLHVMLLNNTIMPNVGTIMRYRANRHVLGQSVGWFENDFAGRIANRIMQTPPAAGHVVFQIFDAMTFAVAYIIGAAILLSQSDVRLVIPLLLWLLAYGGLMYWTVARIGPASQAFADARSQVTGRVVDAYTNIHTVKMFSHHDEELKYANKAIENARVMFQREMRLYVIMDVGLNIINGALMVGVTGWAIYLWLYGTAPIGMVIAATTLTVRLNGMSGWMMWAVTQFFSELGVVREGMETISTPITMRDTPNAPALKLGKGEIEFRDLMHHYGRDIGGLNGVNLRLKAGEKIGLVGHSGAGKSTLVKLLLRFYEAEAGQILIDGQDIKTVQQNSLRSHVGVVQQDSSLLHRSIRDNILYGRPLATDAEMIAVAKQAEAHEFILDLEDANGNRGYDAHVGERGVKLSGGQRQRITLARVMLKNAPILILDEATSALDSTAEASIQKTLYEMMDGKTVIAIAHRLSTIAKMDRIVVMDGGKIVQQGSHAQLLQQKGHYAEFWAHQSDMDR